MLLTPEFYAREYNNRALVPNFAEIFHGWAQASQVARRRSAALLDLAYGDTAPEKLDLFPVRRADGPLFVFLHGGYWRSLAKEDFSFVAPPLVAEGINVAVVNYALCPSVTMAEIVMQTVRALAWLYRNGRRYGFDPNRIFVGGHSAGGHLTAMMLCALWRDHAPDLPVDLVKGGLSISGLYDLAPMVQTDFLNVDLKLDAGEAHRLSPAFMTPATHAPVITAVGGDESSEFHRQNALLAAAWPKHVRHDVPMPGDNHMTVCGRLAEPGSALFQAAVDLCRHG